MNSTIRYLLTSATALFLGASALTAADFVWISTKTANYSGGTPPLPAWEGGYSPRATNPNTTNSIKTPQGFGNVTLNGGVSYLQNFNVDLADSDWLWVGPNSSTGGNLGITGTLTKAGDAALTFANSGLDEEVISLTINKLDLEAGVLNFGRTRERSRDQLSAVTVTGATTISTNATLNVNSPAATFAEVTLSGGTFNILQGNDERVTSTTYAGGVTVAGLSGDSGTVQTRNGVGSVARAAQGTLTLSATSGSYIYGGTLADGSAGSTLTVKKTGASDQTLTGTNTYTGETEVREGTLATGATGDLGLGDVSVFAATLTLGNADSIADTATLFFTADSTINLSFTGTELIGALTNQTTGISALAGFYDASQLNAFFGADIFNGDGVFGVAIPEPSTAVLLAALSSAIFAGLRRRRQS